MQGLGALSGEKFPVSLETCQFSRCSYRKTFLKAELGSYKGPVFGESDRTLIDLLSLKDVYIFHMFVCVYVNMYIYFI